MPLLPVLHSVLWHQDTVKSRCPLRIARQSAKLSIGSVLGSGHDNGPGLFTAEDAEDAEKRARSKDLRQEIESLLPRSAIPLRA